MSRPLGGCPGFSAKGEAGSADHKSARESMYALKSGLGLGSAKSGPDVCSASEAKAAGATIEQMKAAGFRPYECKMAGFTFEEAARAGFVTWGPQRRDFWFSTGKHERDGLDEIGRDFDW